MNKVYIVQWILEWTVGWFFLLARFRFFYDPSKPVGQRWLNKYRQEHLAMKMCTCGLSNMPKLWAWVTACVEVGAGLALITGILDWLATCGLLVTLTVATHCTARQKICEQNPVDWIDWVSCYLWRVEGLYLMMTICILLLEWLP